MPRKPPRDESGRFKAKAAPRRRRPPAPSTSASSAVNPFRMAVEQQGWLAGHGPGWWISDHLEELRHFVSWIYVGVHKVAQQWAQATVNVYDESAEDPFGGTAEAGLYAPKMLALAKHLRRLRVKSAAPDSPAEQRTPITDHPVAKLLEEPNPYSTGRTFRYQVACQIRLTGGCYIWEVPNQFGEPEHLWVIPRGWARPFAPTGQYQQGGYVITPVFNTFTQYTVSPSQSTWNVPFEQMIAVGYPNPTYPGEFTSPLSACSRIIDIMEQTDTATWSSFVNAVKPSLVFNLDPKNGSVSEDQLRQFMAELETYKAGTNNHGKVLAMLGLTVQQLMAGPSELDYVQGRQQNRENVLAVQSVAPVVAGLPGASSYSEAAVQVKTTVELGIAPDLDLFAEKLSKRWQKVEWVGASQGVGGSDLKIEFAPRNYDDPTIELQWVDKKLAGFQAGILSANEARACLKVPPLADPIAEIPAVLLQSMVAPPGSPDPGLAGQGDAEDPYAAFADAGVDLEDGLGDETSTGQRRPELQAASGNGAAKGFSLNGHGRL
jgi:phage portal protein BeeE